MATPATGFDVYAEAPPAREAWQVGLALVKCSTAWCGPCKSIAPTFLAFAQAQLAGELRCYETDADVDQDFAARYSIRVLPTFLLLQDEIEQGRVEGADWDAVLALVRRSSPTV